jgi:hypothetical protein
MEQKISPGPVQVKISAHIVGWLIFLFAPLLLSPGRDLEGYFSDPKIVTSFIVRNIILMIFFYVNLFYITPKIFSARKQTTFIVILVLLIFFIGTANFLIHELLNGPLHDFRGRPHGHPHDLGFAPDGMRPPGPPPPRRQMLVSPYFSSVLIAALAAAASSLIVLWSNWMQAKATEQERNLQKVAAELSVLKLQISPHFLFNTLNNIRWLVRSKSDQAEPALVKLSQLLRYILYQTDHERVDMIKEIEHLRDYISLQRMRLPESDAIEFTLTGDLQGKKIVPLLLIPLIENFFKHGQFILTQKGKIDLKITDHQLIFATENSILPKSPPLETENSGIGLENVKKRLLLNYPGQHDLKYYEQDGVYFVKLAINL